ncbi:MAG: glutamine synthetase [Candidatus Eremiobacteraeota bacterium]|nr:glutamine synthetase [Candidatus Eremiobacteraeota bacterium]MBV9056711.1 glutamine synthetase [Candidatus Eremiobacteraeota bacterium]MBV9699736.1 glutamine synthetase [Candidatus Eremiobacteraeota bacterium]
MRPEPRAPGKRDVRKTAHDRNVRFVRLVFADIFGVSKNVSIPIDQLDAALQGRVTFDGGSIDGFVRGEELDMVLLPDPATFAVYPWKAAPDGSEARLICDIAMPDGSPFEGCPRTTLRRAIESAQGLDGLRVGLEVEFYLFERAAADAVTTATSDVGSYFDFSADDRGEDARNAIVAALREMAVPVVSAHHEHGAGQHEIDIAHDDPLAAADHALTLRAVAKHVATEFGLDATFMPKPLAERAGSGLHADFLLREDTERETALYVAGGLLAHASALTSICNPTVNSYKRLVAAWDAPIYTVWSERSPNALVRVPATKQPRVEMRSPDPACNPYLAFAALIGAAADGVTNRTLPGPPLAGSTYGLSDAERRERGIGTLPTSLRQAIAELDDDLVVRASLGDHLYHAFRDAKLEEYDRYRRAVHPWEREQYLKLY